MLRPLFIAVPSHGVDWPEDHIPVKPIAEVKNVNPVLVPDEDESTLYGAVSTITGTASGTKVALPIIIDRQYQHVAQSKAATATMRTNKFIIAPIMYVVGTIIYLLGVLASTPMVMWKTMNHQTKSFIKSCASASIMLLITAALGIYTWESPETSFRAIDTGRLRNPMAGG